MDEETTPAQETARESETVPCPQCTSTAGYLRVGKFRAMCRGCRSLLKNAEVGLQDQAPQ